MKKSLLFLFLLSGLSIFARENIVDIQAFGRGGSLVPTFMGQPVNPTFFSKPQYLHLKENRFRTFLRLDQGDLQAKRDDAAMLLTLVNWDETVNDVIVSATRFLDNTIRNFLIRVPANEEMLLDIRALQGFDTLSLNSKRDFSAYLDLEAGGNYRHVEMKIQNPLEKSTAEDLSKQTIYCNSSDYWVELRVELFGDKTIYVDADFRRHFLRVSQCHNGATYNEFEIDVYYPDSSTLHARGTGSSAFCSDANCKMYGYSTINISNDNRMHWLHEDGDLSTSNYFDDVIFGSAYGISRCAPGLIQGPDCTGSNAANFKFYVYKPGLGSPQ